MKVFYNFLSLSQIPLISREIFKRNFSFIVLFHGIHQKKYNLIPGAQKDITAKQFDHILSWLEKRFKFITIDQYLAGITGGVCITFDDGLANNFITALPLLEKYNAPSLWFISTQHIKNTRDWLWFIKSRAEKQWKNIPADVPNIIAMDLYDGMSEEQLKQAANHELITIGAHTVTHRWLSDLSIQEQEVEILDSKKYLENLIRKEIDYFAYPKNLYNLDTIEIVKRNFKLGFSVKSKFVKSSPWEIPRIDLYEGKSAYLDLKMSGFFRKPVNISVN